MIHDRTAIAGVLSVSILLGLMSLSIPTAAAQSPSDGAKDEDAKVVFTMGTTTDMATANPFHTAGSTEYEMFFLNYDMLYNFAQDTLEPTAALASYPPEQSADGKTWTFKIREGVRWSDGVPLTAADIAFTYNLINEKRIGAFLSELGDPIAKDAFEAPDDTTLVWHMQTATLAPLAPPWIPILPEHIWGKYMSPKYSVQDLKEAPNVPAVGSGPFHLTEWEPGEYFRMEANPDYWMGRPHVDELVFRVYANPEALRLALTNGEVDAVNDLPPSVFESLKDEPNISTNVPSAAHFYDLAFNFEGTGDPALRNGKVRDAIALAVDRQALVDRVTLGYTTPGTTVVPPVFPRWHWEPSAAELETFDPQAAERLLDEAGYKDGDGDGFRETPDGQPWSLEVLTISDYVYSVPSGKLIVGWLNEIGIKTTIKTVAQGKGFDLWADQDFDMYVWTWGVSPDPDFILSVFTSGECLNWSDGCFSDPAYDEIYQAQRTETDLATRQDLVAQAQQLLYREKPLLVLFYDGSLQAYRNDRFTGFLKQPEPQGYIYFGYGPYSYLHIEPVGAEERPVEQGGGGTGAVWAAIALALLLIGGVVLLLRRGRREKTE